MSDDAADLARGTPAHRVPAQDATIWDPDVEELEEAECLGLISAGGVGRLAYSGPSGVAVLPVSFQLRDGSIVFRTPLDSPTDADLRTGIADADYHVAFEVDEFDTATQDGWMVLIQGGAHHMDSQQDREAAWASDARPPASGTREHFLRIRPTRIAGRRLSRS